MVMPGLKRLEGGNANGVPLSRMAKMNDNKSPRTKIGIDTPMLAKEIVRTSTAEFRL